MKPTIQWRNNPKCVSGSTVIADVADADIIEFTANEALDNNDGAQLVVPWDTWWLESVVYRSTAHVTDALGRVREWRLKKKVDGKGPGRKGTVVITLDPLILDLKAMGFVFDMTLGGGRPWFNLGGSGATIEQYIRSALLPFFTAEGYSWITIGTIDFADERFKIAIERATPLQWAQELTSMAKGEFFFRRNGDTGYFLDILIKRGASAPTLEVFTTRNLIELEREADGTTIVTAVLAAGMVPENDVEVCTIAYAVGRITAIAGSDITVEQPSGAPLILYDDQFNNPRPDKVAAGLGAQNCYLLKPDGSLTQITDTVESTQKLTLASVTGLAVGQDFEIRKNSSGHLVTEVTNPAAIVLFGYVAGTVEDNDLRGERNLIANPFASNWGSVWEVKIAQFNGAHSATTTVAIKGLPAGYVITSNKARLTTFNYTLKITVGGTADGSGNLSVTVELALTHNNNDFMVIQNYEEPTGWVATSQSSGNHRALMFLRRDALLPKVNLSGLVNGAGQTNVNTVVCDGFTNGDKVTPGDTFEAGGRGMIVEDNTVSGGAITFKVVPAVTVSDNAAVTIRKPQLTLVGISAIAFLSQNHAGSASQAGKRIRAPGITIRYTAGMPPVYATAAIAYLNYGATSSTIGIAQSTKPFELQVIKTSDESIISTTNNPDFTIAVGETREETIQVAVPVSADLAVALQVFPLGSSSAGSAPGAVAVAGYLRWLSLHIGYDPNVTAIDGSYANELLELAYSELITNSTQPFTFVVKLVDLSLVDPVENAELAIELGQDLHIQVENAAGDVLLDRVARIVGIQWDLVNPGNTRLTLDTVRPRVTKAVASAKASRLYVQVATTEGTQTAVTQATAPVATPNAPRIIVPEGQQPTDPGTGPITFEPYSDFVT